MTAPKHTPGPWRVDTVPFNDCAIYAEGIDEPIGESFAVMGEHGVDHRVDPEANAKLIAAAPDMFIALLLAQQHIDVSKPAGVVVLGRIHSVIAKATGGEG